MCRDVLMALKVLIAGLCLGTLIGSNAAAASFKAVFETTPFFTQFGGPADNPNDVVSFTITDNIAGGVDLTFENIGTSAELGSVFIAGIDDDDFDPTDGGFDFLTFSANTFEQGIAPGVVFFGPANAAPGDSVNFVSTAALTLTASDIAALAAGAALADPNNGASLAFYSGAFVAIDAAVPAPAALPLLLSAAGILGFAARRRQRRLHSPSMPA